jgi:hypothetical protein
LEAITVLSPLVIFFTKSAVATAPTPRKPTAFQRPVQAGGQCSRAGGFRRAAIGPPFGATRCGGAFSGGL